MDLLTKGTESDIDVTKTWASACLTPDSGDRAEAIARLDELTPAALETLLAQPPATAMEV